MPNAWSDRFFFRLNTQDTARDQVVSFNYKSAPFGQDGFPVEGGDAADIWLRYQTQYWLYVVQFDRVNNCIVAKRKVPTNDNGQWGGSSSLISNKGVYYTLLTDGVERGRTRRCGVSAAHAGHVSIVALCGEAWSHDDLGALGWLDPAPRTRLASRRKHELVQSLRAWVVRAVAVRGRRRHRARSRTSGIRTFLCAAADR